jgi:acyl dehydratase
MTRLIKEFEISESDVRKWCRKAGDNNTFHLDRVAATDGPFEDIVVPGMMVLDRVSGAITAVSQVADGGPPILLGLTNISFHKPVYVDQEFEIECELVEVDLSADHSHEVDFIARYSEGAASSLVSGVAKVSIE